MNEVLDEIIHDYHTPGGDREEREEQLAALRHMSDVCMEEWLRFEERMAEAMARFAENASVPLPKPPSFAGGLSEKFVKAQGYYKLYMFDQAVEAFREVVREQPDFLLGRIYLAMGLLRTGETGEAYRHFQLLVPLTENATLKAISYNAMGCIQVQNRNMEKAYDYFKMADLTDSSCLEPVLWDKKLWPYHREQPDLLP
ncbi:hypothetical protein MJA45_16595 [Paenibacillus aurantius]|uniref:Tetratrico peptide repeat group 5 domain-containing protein n=1 Tax=Paenibacillus aurantius TaxID=2918900 RepID=A0AA96RDC0_9BACL|nr:hypothetical protein [Paenibacillus aurantius]WNQ09251.1 hypothetical protein MJA45_16595 [Paenibacillus aurantius]